MSKFKEILKNLHFRNNIYTNYIGGIFYGFIKEEDFS